MILRMQRSPQQGVYLYSLISQLKGVKQETAMGDFAQMRQALESGVIDVMFLNVLKPPTAESANLNLKWFNFKKGFEVGEEDTIAIGMNMTLELTKSMLAPAKISSEDQVKLLWIMISFQWYDDKWHSLAKWWRF